MTTPVPSELRVVRLFATRGQSMARGITPVSPLTWPRKHPLSIDWWWVDATAWCQDIGDTIGSFTAEIAQGDGLMTVLETIQSEDNKQVGIRLLGGTSGVPYAVLVTLTGATGQDVLAIEIAIRCFSQAPIPALPFGFIANFSEPTCIANYHYMIGGSDVQDHQSSDFSQPQNSQYYYFT
jgi:hypothetical protein